MDKAKWKRRLFLILLGLCVVAALPPFHIWPLAFVGLSGLFLYLDKTETKKQAFFTGWLFGAGFFGGGLYWLTNAFFVHADKHGWLVPIAVPALAAAMGLFIGLTCVLSVILWREHRAQSQVYGRLILFALAWTVLEWVRSWIFTGFPWNLMGTIWAFSDEMIQPAAYMGAYGLSLFTVLAAVLPVGFFYVEKRKKMGAAFLVGLIPIVMFTLGYVRLSDAVVETYDGVLLRLVQPNIAQADKWKKDLKIQNFQKLLDLSAARKEGAASPTHVIWPETAVTFPLNRDERVRRAVGSVAPTGGAVITGTPRMTQRGETPFQVWNSLMVVNEVGQVVANYDKSHLVPFGEYIPFRKILPLQKLTAGGVDFSAGPGPQTIKVGGLPSFSPLICYEIIFPGAVKDEENRPQWLLNVTNDGWYGNSPGPYQHLISARMRSVEEGLPLVRSANTGITVVTDGFGRIRHQIAYGNEGFIDVELPKPLVKAPMAATWQGLVNICLLLVYMMIAQWIFITYRKR
ncbi:Apolipoprotein N-acyltransferase [Candidatus Terasakiella magnetica]|uniref:Apolipoprotein N-acyltransferase n=1 Tax=Candidatus Terasakiella magnetica TaxID=1867952 RepID=A0A1C3RED6_9PROT|nr:apolipoprotein N-acyltransferase [Candidatus Terasakiella magnetica]SCA55601.1 Apolipoprotein N-acyltransferase [Candidatus Terasakiella magnetica]